MRTHKTGKKVRRGEKGVRELGGQGKSGRRNALGKVRIGEGGVSICRRNGYFRRYGKEEDLVLKDE